MSSAVNEMKPQRHSYFVRAIRVASAASFMVLMSGLVSCGEKEKKKAPEKAMVVDLVIPPPPPPPPPPPTPQQEPPPQEEKKEEFVEETQPEETPQKDDSPEPADSPPDLGLAAGDGPGGYGPSGRGSGGNGTGTGSGKARSRFGWYAGQVQSVIADALRANPKTRTAAFSIRVAIWADSTGRVTRASLINSTGNTTLDQVIRQEVLTGIRLREAPPEGMPMPIQLRLTARKPN